MPRTYDFGFAREGTNRVTRKGRGLSLICERVGQVMAGDRDERVSQPGILNLYFHNSSRFEECG